MRERGREKSRDRLPTVFLSPSHSPSLAQPSERVKKEDFFQKSPRSRSRYTVMLGPPRAAKTSKPVSAAENGSKDQVRARCPIGDAEEGVNKLIIMRRIQLIM
jgi:hypothetical protein